MLTLNELLDRIGPRDGIETSRISQVVKEEELVDDFVEEHMARAQGGAPSLNELMGSGGEKPLSQDLTLDDLPKLLGEKMPEIPLDRVGRFRLRRALQIRFGDGFGNIPGVKSILQDFDKRMNTEVLIRANRKGREDGISK